MPDHPICMFSLEKCLFRPSAYFFGCVSLSFFFFVTELYKLFYILKIKPLLGHHLQIFSPSLPVGYLFILLEVYFAMQNLISLIGFHLFIFAFVSNCLGRLI